jgi:hypothetical protein
VTIRDPKRRRWVARAARSGFAVSSVAFVLSVAGAVATDVRPAVAAAAGTAQVIEPFEVGVPGSGAPLESGDSLTPFSLNLPAGAACSGDSATANYTVQSYMVAASVDPATLTFDNDGPVPSAYGEPQSAFRQPLWLTDSSAYVNAFTAAADQPGGPGSVINIPAFDLHVFDPGETGETYLPPGEFNIGIACWGPGTDPVVDNFWNARITVVQDDADTGPVGITWTAAPAPEETTVTLVVEPSGSAAAGDVVALAATIAPAEAAGTVTFLDGTEELGEPVDLIEGKASLTVADLEEGDHTLLATFTPDDPVAFGPSTSPEVEYTITEAGATTTTSAGATTTSTTAATTTTTVGAVVASTGTGPAGGVGVGALARTGASLSAVVWGALLVVFGRMAVLLGRPPRVVPVA